MSNGGTWNQNINDFNNLQKMGWQNLHQQYELQPDSPNQYLQHSLSIYRNTAGQTSPVINLKKEPGSETFDPFVVCSNQRQYAATCSMLEQLQLPLQAPANPPTGFQLTRNPGISHTAYVNDMKYFTGHQVTQLSEVGKLSKDDERGI